VTEEPRWLSLDAVVALNREIVAAAGEEHAVIDRAALQVAVARPWNVWAYFMDGDCAALAAALLASLYGARAFACGNKRTACRAALAFLEANGLTLALGGHAHACDRLYEYFAGRLSQRGVVEWFRLWLEPR
jgi:prophage maintenance system killer protein